MGEGAGNQAKKETSHRFPPGVEPGMGLSTPFQGLFLSLSFREKVCWFSGNGKT